MLWSIVLAVCLAFAIPVETKSVSDNISEPATLSTFLAFLIASIYIASTLSTESSSSSEEEEDSDSKEEVYPDQSGDEVHWEFVQTGKSKGNIYQLYPL